MIQLAKVKASDIKTLNFKGVEIMKTVENGDDFRSIEFRDTVTNEHFQVTMSPYSDFCLYATKPKKTKKVFRLNAIFQGYAIVFTDDTRKGCETKVKEDGLTDATITEIEVEDESV